jgi:hypothetical protein
MAGEVPVLVRQAQRATSLRPCAAPDAVPAAVAAGSSGVPPGDLGTLSYRSMCCKSVAYESVSGPTVRQARELLAGWAAEHDAVDGRRDEVVQAAIEAA